QRHRAAAPGRGAGPAGGGAVYLYAGPADRPLRRRRGLRRDGGLVPREPAQALRPAGVHGGIDTRPPLAHSGRGIDDMGEQPPVRLILASGSLGRRELLKRAGYAFEVRPANVDEPTGAGVTDIRSYVQSVAWMKAAALAPQVAEGVVIAADTVGWLGGQVIGKPEDEADARRILKALG